MIATLEGKIGEKLGDLVVLDVAGVGYGVLVISSDFSTLTTDKPAKLYIYEHIKEDSHDLYGFKSLATKKLFEQLLSVKNVGPKVALAVLDIGSIEAIGEAIAGGNVKLLQTAKGVGKRAAEQIVVELRDKVGVAVGEGAENIVGRSGVNTQDEAVQALIALGYSDYDAQSALAKVDSKLPLDQRIKQALKAN